MIIIYSNNTDESTCMIEISYKYIPQMQDTFIKHTVRGFCRRDCFTAFSTAITLILASDSESYTLNAILSRISLNYIQGPLLLVKL